MRDGRGWRCCVTRFVTQNAVFAVWVCCGGGVCRFPTAFPIPSLISPHVVRTALDLRCPKSAARVRLLADFDRCAAGGLPSSATGSGRPPAPQWGKPRPVAGRGCCGDTVTPLLQPRPRAKRGLPPLGGLRSAAAGGRERQTASSAAVERMQAAVRTRRMSRAPQVGRCPERGG